MFSPPPADFVGQYNADRIMTYTITGASILGIVSGFFLQSLSLVFKVFAVGVLIAAFAVIPPWPYQRKNPIKFAPEPVPSSSSDTASADDSTTAKASSESDAESSHE
ncbi:microsomal signal peptidase 12 kDa subunit-domain-containing protein [Catenaria anguillulae PL171]|uniref:Signal peptidase complex subunit 1 n=1 Tax=Catenaria anguillulae PL171 TaxID=765915 RepID=A0A1Y2HHF8_9FUNG|nr:microsomal signal peptidase 12 kDa subunit-domain-containing protein [Catenaria anguillulae PL171]